MFAPHDATIFAARNGVVHAWYIPHCYLDDTVQVTAGSPGVTEIRTVTLYIGKDVEITDLVTGQPVTYQPAQTYDWSDPTQWTLVQSGLDGISEGYYAKGRADTVRSYPELAQTGAVYRIAGIADYDYGPQSMQHWEVTGR